MDSSKLGGLRSKQSRVIEMVDGAASNQEGQHNAKQIAHAPQFALRSPNSEPEVVPVASDLLVREPNHSTFISDRQQSAILR